MLEVNLHPFPQIETERLLLRQITMNDADEIFELRSNKRVMAYIERPMAQSIKDAEEMIARINKGIENNEGINWAMTLKGDDQLIGIVSLWRIMKEQHRAETGYMLLPDYYGKGIMQEALSATLNFGFDVLKLHSVEAHVNPSNEASIKILERNGFAREAYFRENHFHNGKFYDTAVYSLLTNR